MIFNAKAHWTLWQNYLIEIELIQLDMFESELFQLYPHTNRCLICLDQLEKPNLPY